MPSPEPSAPADPSVLAARAKNDRMLMRALLIAVGVGIAADLVVLALAAVLGDGSALRGALIGSGLALIVTLPTLASALLSRRLPPVSWAMVLMGSWMVKMLLLIIALLLLAEIPGISRPWLGIALLAGALAAAFAEALGMVRSRPRLEVAGSGRSDAEHS